jgi:hypothetical protein
MSCIDPLDWLPEESYRLGLNEALNGLHEHHRGAIGDVDGNSPLTQPQLKVVEVADEQRWLAGRGYDSRICIKGQLDVV